MEPLLEAIKTQCANSASIVSAFPAVGGVSVSYFGDLAPETAPLPYLVSTVIAAPSNFSYGGNEYAEATVQFSAYGNGRAATYTRIKAFADVFDELVFSLSSGHLVNTYREGQPIPQFQPDKDDQAQDVWGWIVSYVFTLTPKE